jgi:CheY-specific phosphatase CheX
MTESDFAEKDVKEFTGMLTAWLLYHVADADQKILKEMSKGDESRDTGDIIFNSVCYILHIMAGFGRDSMKKAAAGIEASADTYAVKVEFFGDMAGNIVFVYPIGFIKNFIDSTMGFKPDAIDELVLAALFEVSKSICEMICGRISRNGGKPYDIKTPYLTQRKAFQSDERVSLDTGEGIIEIDIAITYKEPLIP